MRLTTDAPSPVQLKFTAPLSEVVSDLCMLWPSRLRESRNAALRRRSSVDVSHASNLLEEGGRRDGELHQDQVPESVGCDSGRPGHCAEERAWQAEGSSGYPPLWRLPLLAPHVAQAKRQITEVERVGCLTGARPKYASLRCDFRFRWLCVAGEGCPMTRAEHLNRLPDSAESSLVRVGPYSLCWPSGVERTRRRRRPPRSPALAVERPPQFVCRRVAALDVSAIR